MHLFISQIQTKKAKIDNLGENDGDDYEDDGDFDTAEAEEERDWISCVKIASILREGKERVVQVQIIFDCNKKSTYNAMRMI